MDIRQRYIASYIRPMTEDWLWKINADAATRATNPTYYWFHTYYGPPRYLWDEFDVSEEEYRAHARPEDVTFLDERLRSGDQLQISIRRDRSERKNIALRR
jgi:hypothetical protein